MPKLTQSLTMHLNGGSEWSELHHKILSDGKETGITHHVRTDGSPHYKILADEFHFGEETFDMLKEKGVDVREWIEARV